MVSTFTANLGLENQGNGDHNNSWGTTLNGNFTIIDRNTQRLSLSVAGGTDVTLTATQAQYRSLVFTGVLTGNISVIFPAASTQGWQVDNQTTGNFTLTCKLSGGTGVTVAQGEKNMVEGDGTNMVARKLLGQNLQEIHGTTGGSANAQTLTLAPAITAYKKGQIFTAIAGFSNSGATTLAVSGLAATAVQLNGSACVGGEIVVNKPFTVMHDGSVLQLLNSPAIAAAGGGAAFLSAANAFTAANTFSLAVAGNNVSLTTTDAGAVGSTLRLYHNSASPANSDVTGIITFDGKDSGAADQVWANIRVSITDVTAASEDANLLFQTVVAGTVATRATIGAGLQLGAPTGGDVANSINVSGTLRVNNDPAATLAAANAFTAAQSITLATAGNNLTLGTTDAGAVGSTLVLDHNTASPANADTPGAITFSGRDSGAGAQTWATVKAVITDVTAASEDAELRFSTVTAGSVTESLRLGAGVYTPGATAGDKGVDTINTNVYYQAGSVMLAPDALSNGASTSASAIVTNNGLIYIASGAGFTLTLPALANVFNGYRVGLQNECTSGVCLANRSSSDTITSQDTSGLTAITLPSVGDMVWFIADKVNSRWVLQGKRSFESAGIAPNAATDTQAHSLGVVPKKFSLVLKNTTAELGYSIGDEVPHPGVTMDQVGAGRHHQMVLDATNGVLLQGTTVTQPVLNKTTPAAGVNVTAGSWRWFWRAEVIN